MKRKNYGFTLIEILIVLAIIGILFVLFMPAIGKVRESSQTTACINNMKQITLAALMYADDHEGALPDIPLTADYIDDEDTYICPRDDRPGLGVTKASYTASTLTPVSLLPSDTNGQSSNVVIYIESNKMASKPDERKNINLIAGASGETDMDFRHGNGNISVISFLDGHVQAYREDDVASVFGPDMPAGTSITGGGRRH